MRKTALRWPPWGDVALALGVCLLGLIELEVSDQEAVSVVTVAVMTLPVAFRRRAPVAAALVIATWLPVDHVLGGEYATPLTPLLASMLVAYTLTAHATPRRAVASTALLLISLELSLLLAGAGHYGVTAFCVALPALSGASVRRYRARSRQLTVLTARLERERGASERLAVAEERRRIAGELHDTIAHAVSRMVVQAAGAEQVLASAPARARAALIAVQDTGRDAIAELRHTLRILRTDDEPARRPPPSEQDASVAGAPARPTISWPWWADILLAVGLIAAVEGPALWNASALLTVAAVGAAVAIVLRRRHPVGALSLAVTEDVFLVAAGYDDRAASAFIAVLVVLYTLGVHGPPRRALVATAVPSSRSRSSLWRRANQRALLPSLSGPWRCGRRVVSKARLGGRRSGSRTPPRDWRANATRSRGWRRSTNVRASRAICMTRSRTPSVSWCCRPAPPSRCLRRRPTRRRPRRARSRPRAAKHSASYASCSVSYRTTRKPPRARRSPA